MTRTEAIAIFQLSDGFTEEAFSEALENMVFEWKKDILRIAFSVELMQLKLKKLERLANAFHTLSNKNTASSTLVFSEWKLPGERGLKSLLDNYESTTTQFRLALSSATAFPLLSELMNALIDFQDQWERAWLLMSSEWNLAEPLMMQCQNEQVKISEGTPAAELRRAFVQLGGNEANPFLLKALLPEDNATKEALITLYKERVRAMNALKRRDENG